MIALTIKAPLDGQFAKGCPQIVGKRQGEAIRDAGYTDRRRCQSLDQSPNGQEYRAHLFPFHGSGMTAFLGL